MTDPAQQPGDLLLPKRPGLCDLLDLPGYPGPNTGDTGERLFTEPGDRKGEVLDLPCCPRVGKLPGIHPFLRPQAAGP